MQIAAERIHAYRLEITAIIVTTSTEVLIALERAISAIDPLKYYETSRLAKVFILPTLMLVLIVAVATAYVSVGKSFILTGTVFFSLDLLTILVNTVSMKYCRKRDLDLLGNGSLNARYQVKEAADMASAMQPALIIAFIIKTMTNMSFMSVCLRIDVSECVPLLLSLNWGILEAFFMTNTIISGVFLNIWLVRKNLRLRRKAEKFLRRLRQSGKVAQSSVVNVPQRNSVGDIYFDELKRAWDK
ncbi:hypothetical protein PRIPAC_77690 [Pristionchus pacificus]|nr:hypothetical protein PRIPAC_77690 [Pristionchus pacificus]